MEIKLGDHLEALLGKTKTSASGQPCDDDPKGIYSTHSYALERILFPNH